MNDEHVITAELIQYNEEKKNIDTNGTYILLDDYYYCKNFNCNVVKRI